ncbi:MAG: hypothetical protein K6E86_07485 [Bacteroidales bacterium]|nr:hypothetical protein [Bacteroidales bacterium]
MKKVLLSLAAVGMTMSANAQLLNYGFETTDLLPGALVTENWSDIDAETSVNKFENCQFDLKNAGTGIDGSTSLWATTDVTCGTWQRVVAFTNVGLQENKSYRISLWVKGEGDFNLALLKGCFNHDQALVGGNGTTYVDQTKTYTAADASDYVRYSYVVWSPSREVMSAKKEDLAQDEYWNQDFLRLSFNGKGTYYVDDIKIEESSVQALTFNGNAIYVDFGYETNGAALVEAAQAAVLLDKSCVTVKVDGEEAEVASVEIKDGGKFYIFMNNDIAGENVTVSFTNPGDLKYSTNVAPKSFDEPNCAVLDFENEAALYDANLVAVSTEWEEAALVTSVPQDNSFEWGNDINSFSFTFNKPVSTNDPENGAPVALLFGQGLPDEGEALQVVASEELNATLTFQRTGTTALVDGVYTVTVDNVSNSHSVATTTPFSASFEVGKVEVAVTEYTKVAEGHVASEAYPAAGWTIYNEGEVRNAAESYGSGPRQFNFTNSTVEHALYFRTKFADNGDSGVGYVCYGDLEGYGLTLPEGDIEFRPIVAAWKNAGFKLIASVLDASTKEVIASQEITTSANANGATDKIEFQADGIRFTSTGQNVIFKVEIADKENQHEALCGGFEVYTYQEGTNLTNETLLAETFSDVNDSYIPAAGSGWRIHRDGNIRTPGANGGWGGNCATGGGGPRMFQLSYKNLGGKGVYLASTTNVLTYGEFLTYEATEGEGEEAKTVTKDEKTLTLPAGRVEITFYTALWKATGVKYYFEIIPQEEGFSGTPIFSKSEVINTESPNGDKNAEIEAMKTQFFFTAPAEGKYLLRFYTDGEAFVGNISIVTVASVSLQYKLALAEALVPAKEELTTAQANELYAGTTLNKLSSAITAYENPDFHTAVEYKDAIADLEALIKAMATRRTNIDEFAGKVDALKAQVESAAEKYSTLQAYIDATELVNELATVAPEKLEDDVLSNYVARISKCSAELKNQIENVIPLVTKQLTTLAAALVEYDEATYANNDVVVLAGKALTDDQVLAEALKMYNTARIYQQIADGYNFTTFDTLTQTTQPDSIDVTAWIQNGGFYCDFFAGSQLSERFPGWNIVTELSDGGYIREAYSWETTINVTAENPIQDRGVYAGGNDKDYITVDVSQQLTNLPAGVFTYYIETCDRTGRNWNNGTPTVDDPDPMKSYVYYEVSEDNKAQQQFAHVEVDKNQWYPLDKNYMYGVTVPTADVFATVKIGANLMPFKSSNHGEIDNAKLYMTGKIDGFDYAAAATKALNAAVSDLRQVEVRDDAPVQVTYFNMAGQQSVAPQGVSLKVERYSDGYVVVKKVLVK